MYVVTVGVSDYNDKNFKLNYAAKDAGDIAKLFQKSDAYANVYTKVYVNKEVTSKCIEEIKAFLAKAGTNDEVILFFAGHGVLDQHFDYYFATVDLDFNNPSVNGIPYPSIESVMDGLAALKKTLIMDTCHIGEIDKNDVTKIDEKALGNNSISFRSSGQGVGRKNLGLAQTNELMKEMFVDLRKGTGANVISSAGGYELAKEGEEWSNGLFTYVMMDGIKSMKADLDKNGKIMISELKSYVGDKVMELSGGTQLPTSRMENISFDYRVW